MSEVLELRAVCLLTELCSIILQITPSIDTDCVSRGAPLPGDTRLGFSLLNVLGVEGGQNPLSAGRSS